MTEDEARELIEQAEYQVIEQKVPETGKTVYRARYSDGSHTSGFDTWVDLATHLEVIKREPVVVDNPALLDLAEADYKRRTGRTISREHSHVVKYGAPNYVVLQDETDKPLAAYVSSGPDHISKIDVDRLPWLKNKD